MNKQFLVVLAQEHINFRIPEVESVSLLFGKNFHEIWNKDFILCERNIDNGNAVPDIEKKISSNCFTRYNTPYIVLHNIDEQDVANILSRTMFARSAYEIWGYGRTYDDLKKSVQEYPTVQKQFSYTQSFCIRVKAFGKKISLHEQVKKIDGFQDTLPFRGQVDLNSPENEFHLIEDYGMNTGKKVQGDPHCMYFGRLLGGGQRSLIQAFSVKNRKFIGNTSMDACLSFIMSNVACIKSGYYVCDPFVGTGSLLIAAARHGAFVTGGDINYNILHARGKSSRVGAGYRQKDETIQNSLKQYGLGDKYVDVMVCDAAKNAWVYTNKAEGIFDAIITDPPYGIRESCRKVGTDKEVPDTSGEYEQHHPEQTPYHLDQVFTDLLSFASHTLMPGGRLVYWLPIYIPEYSDENIPRHSHMDLIYNCEQPLKRETSRRMIVMQKRYNIIESDSDIQNQELNNCMYKGHNAFRNKYFKLKADCT